MVPTTASLQSDSSTGCIAGPPLRDLRCLKSWPSFANGQSTQVPFGSWHYSIHAIIILRPSLVSSHLHGCTTSVPRPSIEEVWWLFWEASSVSRLLVGVSDRLTDRLAGWFNGWRSSGSTGWVFCHFSVFRHFGLFLFFPLSLSPWPLD